MAAEAEKVSLYHPELDVHITASPGAAVVHRRHGWIDTDDPAAEVHLASGATNTTNEGSEHVEEADEASGEED